MNCILVEYKSIHISQIVNQFFTLCLKKRLSARFGLIFWLKPSSKHLEQETVNFLQRVK